MKNSLLSIAALTAILMQGAASADDKTLMDYMNRDTDKFYVIAEKPDEMLIKIGATGGVLFFGDSDDKKALVDYCNDVNGKASLSPLAPRTYEALFLDHHTNIVCTAPNGKGFKGQFYKPNSSEKNYQNAWLDVKFDSPQTKKYLMQNYLKRNMKPEEKKATDLIVGSRGLYYTFENGLAMCERNGGKYFMATDVTQGYAMSSHDYLFALSNKLGNFDSIYASEYSMGKHWCVDTTEKSNEFTVTVIKQNGYNAFKPEMGVDRSQMKFSTDLLPPYYMKSVERTDEHVIENSVRGGGQIEKINYRTGKVEHIGLSSENSIQANQSVAMSRTPNSEESSLVEKSINSRSNTLGRVNGRILEAIYLGRNEKGCDLAAVTKQTDQPYGHKYAYGKNDGSEAIMGYRKCNGQTEFIGESFEKKFPVAVENEYNRVLGMCKLRGAGMGSYLGYNIDCQRLGAINEPVYETLIVKQDKLVVRVLEK